MKRLLVVAAGIGLASAAWAEAANNSTQLQPMAYLQTPSTVQPAAGQCLTETGSHLRGNSCISAQGSVYVRDDLNGVSGGSWTEVLRRDPSITIEGGSGRH